MDYSLKEVAGRIKDLREAKGFTQEELAKLTGVSTQEYEVLEKGDSDFSFTFIYKCAKACGVEVVDLLEGTSTTLTSFAITRKGEGLKIVKKHGVEYNNLAPKFREKLAEPFLVKFPYLEEEQNAPMQLNSHNGQEFDVIVKGSLKVQVGNHVDVLHEGDSIFYNSLIPHGMVAVSEGGCEFHAVVLNPHEGTVSEEYPEAPMIAAKVAAKKKKTETVADKFIESSYDENGVFNGIKFKNADSFNFAFDCVDAIAEKNPDKLAMMWVANDKTDRRFTFSDMKKYSAKTANYFESLGIKKGDTVMLTLKRSYFFWYCILGLHKIGAIVVQATDMLKGKDYVYRCNAGKIKAVIITGDADETNYFDFFLIYYYSSTTKPSFKRIVRSVVAANVSSWVTMMTVQPSSWASDRRICTILEVLAESRLPVGSSARMILQPWARVRAMATRCCSPPESWAGKFPFRSERPTLSNVSDASKYSSHTCAANSTFSKAVRFGTRL